MAATIEIEGVRATCHGYQWTCTKRKDFERLLNGLLNPLGPLVGDPNPDLHAAQKAIEVLGGEIIEYDETEWEEGVIY